MYNVDYTLKKDVLTQTSTFISRTQNLNIRLKTNNQNIQNVKLVINNVEYYMMKDIDGSYNIQLYKNMVNEGENTFYISIEDRINKDYISNTLSINLYKNNIIQKDFDYIELIITKLNKILITI